MGLLENNEQRSHNTIHGEHIGTGVATANMNIQPMDLPGSVASNSNRMDNVPLDGLEEQATHPARRSIGLDAHNRVRFSDDMQRSTPGTFNASASSEPKPAIRHSRTLPTTEPPRPALRNRDRGYSLRRTLFAQNVQNNQPEHGPAIELQTQSSNSRDVLLNDDQPRKGSVIISVDDQEAKDPNPIRLSDPALDLPLYSRWVKQHGAKKTALFGFFDKFKTSFKRYSERTGVPSSKNGRSVVVNTNSNFSPIDERTGKPYISNMIISCKYTIYNFFPKQLAAQLLGKIANIYFLCVSILKMIPGLSTTGTYTTIIPLLIFVGISMAKEGYDDIRRSRLDKEENERTALVLTTPTSHTSNDKIRSNSIGSDVSLSDCWKAVKWFEIKVGDVLLLQRDAPVPADIILLHSDGPNGASFIETKSLDGETNLKTKTALKQLQLRSMTAPAVMSLEADFVVEDPNLDLYKFEGKVSIGGEVIPLTSSEVIYRGSILRNTNSIYGLVVYSGEECKIRMNANKNPRVKAPTLQAKVNRVVIFVACLVLFIAVILSIGHVIWYDRVEDGVWYLSQAAVPFIQILVSFFIMLNTMLPLSLYVSLEIVKVIQMFMMNDIDMYDAESDTPMEARTSTLNEELGQVNYIFSDKTGTLTNNSMKFRRMSVAGTSWLHDVDLREDSQNQTVPLRHKKRALKGKGRRSTSSKIGRPSKSATADERRDNSLQISPNIADNDFSQNMDVPADPHRTEKMLEYIYQHPQGLFARKAKLFLLALALCHTCVPEHDEEGNITYQASSPDEAALVVAAQDMGYIVIDRQANTITLRIQHSEDDDTVQEVYEILDVIEFSSARKRMSIILRLPDGRICLFCKGADTTLRQLLRLKDLAETQFKAINRKANTRKSMEAQAAIKRRSTQISRASFSSVPQSATQTRNNSVTIDSSIAVRHSIDVWLKERENDVDSHVTRTSMSRMSPRSSMQGFPGRNPFQSENSANFINESTVVDDNFVFERCFSHIDDFATEGLRTLLYAYRYITEESYIEWKGKYHAASTSLIDRQERMEKVGELLEKNLELIGATAIEDKLQDGVPDAIERFRRAGIKMWMLTGDKRETAINIGHSCRLIKDYSTVIVMDHNLGDLPARLANAIMDVKHTTTAHSVLVIDGQTLTVIDSDPAMKALFSDVAIAADSVICCRASPSQKADLVKTIRTKVQGSVTLAIGDGANDIAMIQEAHLGIGIAGKEGLQAARTSDYSIAQFRFLLKLLLVHGRWNYVRVCKYTLGTFWKEMIFYLVQATFQRWTGYTGTSLYEPWSLSMFNTLFTSLPVIFMGAFEKDMSPATLLAVPELYSMGNENRGFNLIRYAQWAFLGAIEAVIVFFVTYGIFGEAPFTKDQQLFSMGALAFSSCVIIISLKLQFFELHNKTIMAAIAMFLSIGGWWLWNLLLSLIYPKTNPIYDVNTGLIDRFGRNLLWWMTILIAVVAVCVLEFSIKAIKAVYFPSDTEVFQAYERDVGIKMRFEESAAKLLQQGWNRGIKKSSLEIVREEEIQAQREADVQAILDQPRIIDDVQPSGLRKRTSWAPVDEGLSQHPVVHKPQPPTRKSLDIGEFFTKGYGMVRKGSLR